MAVFLHKGRDRAWPAGRWWQWGESLAHHLQRQLPCIACLANAGKQAQDARGPNTISNSSPCSCAAWLQHQGLVSALEGCVRFTTKPQPARAPGSTGRPTPQQAGDRGGEGDAKS